MERKETDPKSEVGEDGENLLRLVRAFRSWEEVTVFEKEKGWD